MSQAGVSGTVRYYHFIKVPLNTFQKKFVDEVPLKISLVLSDTQSLKRVPLDISTFHISGTDRY